MIHLLSFALALILAVSPGVAHGQAQMRLAAEIPLSIVNVPMAIAIDRLKQKGARIEVVEFQSPETMMLALQNGQVDLVGTSAGTAFSAIDAGFDGKAILGMAMSDFHMVAKTGLSTCESLHGKNVAVQSREGTTGVLLQRWLASACPSARPNIMIVPGSENRVAGLLAGQLDASPIDSQNTASLMAQRPGQFHTIDSFAQSGVLASVYVASSAWLRAQPQTVRQVAEAYTQVINEAKTNKAEFLARTKALVPTMKPELVDYVVTSWVEKGILVPVSAVSPARIEDAIKFYGSARPYRRIKGYDDVATAEFVKGLQGN
jgi:ABC-type nitrate/sulfonate/bicarbonate transport system substrate-binding protein